MLARNAWWGRIHASLPADGHQRDRDGVRGGARRRGRDGALTLTLTLTLTLMLTLTLTLILISTLTLTLILTLYQQL